MTRNSSYSSSSSEKPRCPNCGNIIALTVHSCPQCGFRKFFRANKVVNKETCSKCEGDGKARWYTDEYKWLPPSTDYCTECYGRGYNLTYNLIDLRCNQVSENEFAYDSLHRSPLNTSEYDMPPAKPIHRGKAPRPSSSFGFIGILFLVLLGIVMLSPVLLGIDIIRLIIDIAYR